MAIEAMPVLWAIGRGRAHLMQFDARREPNAPPWRSPCGWAVRRTYASIGDAARGQQPHKPWCTGCVRIAARTIAGYTLSGILEETNHAN